jgi:hypothetical protein
VDRDAMTINIVEAKEWRTRTIDETNKRQHDDLIRQQQAVIAWLKTTDSLQEDELDTQLGRCHANTCNWITQNGKLGAWMGRGPGKKILWLKGKPGAGKLPSSLPYFFLILTSWPGKTVLCSRLIRFLKQDGHTIVLYYFCNNYRSQESDDLVHILRAFCAQLLQSRPDFVPYFYDQFLAKGLSPSTSTLIQALRPVMASINFVRMVVDGLDEWNTESVRKTVDSLVPLLSSGGQETSQRLLFSSRDVPQISKTLSKAEIISLNEEKLAINEAMRLYVHDRIGEIGYQFQSHVSSRVLESIENELVKKADGNYF